MCLKAMPIPPIPEETAMVARAVYPNGNIYMQMRDTFDGIYTDDMFTDLYPIDGQPALSPWRLALVTVMQFMENLSDRQAAEAVRDRIGWKYALSLELTDQGFHYSVLSEFRSRLVTHEAGERLLDELLWKLADHGLLKGKHCQRTDSTHILSVARDLNRLENVGETLRHALNSLAVAVPEWLRAHVPLEWFDLYGKRFENWRFPRTKAEQSQLAIQVGADGMILFTLIYERGEPWLRELPAVETLRQVWLQQYWLDDGQVKQRDVKHMPPAGEAIRTPYDVEARYSTKRSTEWTGYKLHITETCNADAPRIMTQVETTKSTVPDCESTTDIQRDLLQRDLKPDHHFMDAGYIDASNLATSQHQFAIDLIGPARPDTSWQAQDPDAFDITHFKIDWQQRQAHCPAGQTSCAWVEGLDQTHNPVIRVRFADKTCMQCPFREQCTRGVSRSITLRPQAEHEALQTARQREQTEAFKTTYRQRAGIEGSIAQVLRVTGLRRSRYVGLDKTHLQNVIAAVSINLIRVFNWLDGIPIGTTRQSPFCQLKTA